MNLIRYLLAETLFRLVPVLPFNPLRQVLYRLCGMPLPCSSKILWGARFYNGVVNGYRNLEVGRYVYVAENCFFDLTEKIILRDRATLSMGVRILTHADPGHSALKNIYGRKVAAVTVGEDAWVGAYALILPGLTIGPGAVVAAGSVVTRDVPPGALVAGVPAEVKRCLTR